MPLQTQRRFKALGKRVSRRKSHNRANKPVGRPSKEYDYTIYQAQDLHNARISRFLLSCTSSFTKEPTLIRNVYSHKHGSSSCG